MCDFTHVATHGYLSCKLEAPISNSEQNYCLEVYRFCTQLSQTNADITLQITSQPLPFTCFTVILPLDVTSPDTPTSLNGSYMH